MYRRKIEADSDNLQSRVEPAQGCPGVTTCNGSCPLHCQVENSGAVRRLLPSIPRPERHSRLLPYVDEADRERRIAIWQSRMNQAALASPRKDDRLSSQAEYFCVPMEGTATTDESSSAYARYKEEARAARRIQKSKKRSSSGDKKDHAAP